MSTWDRALALLAILSDEGRAEVAGYFEVAPSTVTRWVAGTARPHPRLRRQIEAYMGVA